MTALGRKLGEISADFVGEKIGSWGFVGFQSFAIALWMGWNLWSSAPIDPAPFIGLNLLLSLQAAYTGPVLLISANRQTGADRRKLNAIEHEVKHVRMQLRAVLDHLGVDHPEARD